MRKFSTINFNALKISLQTGLIGGIVLAFLSNDPFKLYYIGGYLIFLTLVLTVFSSIFFYRKVESKSIFFEKVQVGLVAYIIAIILFTVYQIFINQFYLKSNIEEYLQITLFHLGGGLLLSILISICINGFSYCWKASEG